MAIRCVYTDLDGTLLGRGASLFRDAEGGFTLLPARARRSRASVSSTGRLNESDLPLAVPVVTIVWPRMADSSASAWCE